MPCNSALSPSPALLFWLKRTHLTSIANRKNGMNSDPELLLWSEAHAQNDRSTWQYAPARFTDLSIKLRYKNVEVWSHERGQSAAANSPYMTGRVSARSSHIE
jgi:hypothetical protein